jgi:ABC-type transport system involved in multi-copper enzyme maturation permease subunit
MPTPIVLAALTTWLKPLWLVAVGVVIALAALFALSWLLRLVFPKVAAIAGATAKEALSQPLFYVLLGIGAFALIIFPFVPYNTFGEDIKVIKDSGLTLLMVLSILLALWTASVSVSEEIDGRTALTLLSKPIGRRQFILGKFLGIVGPVVILFIVLGALFLATVSYKVVYDARESALPEPSWQECREEMVQTVPGLVLALMEAIVLASISVAISTRLPMLPNLVICTSIYVLGHLVPMLVKSAIGQFEIVRFVGNFLATILPVLENFNVYTAIATGREVPLIYLAWAGLYCVLFSGVALLLALLLFEDRDLA